MNAANTIPPDPRPAAPATLAVTRPMVWSVRREIWENRSVYLAPLAVAAVVLFSCLAATMTMPRKMRTLDAAKQYSAVVTPISMSPAPIMLATIIVGVFYCLDALYGDRRDRSILFFKSLPVSDRTTVLSKAAVPFVVLPAIAYVLGMAVQLVVLVATMLALVGRGVSPAILGQFAFFQGLVIAFYGLAVHALWYAPIYGWLLLVSAWAKRAPVLWALLPLLAISAVERIAFGSWHFMTMLQYRVGGAMQEAFRFTEKPPGEAGDIDRLSQLDPLNFFSRPGLWAGLLFAAAFLALAVRLRQQREPI